MDATLNFDAERRAALPASLPAWDFPFAATTAFAGAAIGLAASGWLTLRAMANSFAVASGHAAFAGALKGFSAAEDPVLPSLEGTPVVLDPTEAVSATERLAEAWGAHVKLPASTTAQAQGDTAHSVVPAAERDTFSG